MIEIRRPCYTDYEPVKALLAAAGLPVDDFAPKHLCLVAGGMQQPVAAIGCEALGDTWLLRSLVVDSGHRSHGLGAKLVAALEEKAREAGAIEVWLLTIDADGFFATLGYRRRDRDEAPQTIRGTAEFSALCPASAILMSHSLA